jgi:hypothetical protein
MAPHASKVSVRVLQPPGPDVDVELPNDDPLSETLIQGAAALSVTLLPSPQEPLDKLRNEIQHGEFGPPIGDLDQPLGEYLHEPHTSKRFAIELVLAIRVNTRWAIATADSMSPRQILELPGIDLDYSQYTLYLPNSTEVLPLDTPIALHRGIAFEAQRDGKYGAP